MSDSEGSVASLHGSEKSATRDETVEAMPTQQNQNGDKLEEFQTLLQSMIVSRSPSEEEEQVEEDDNANANEKKIVGRPSCLPIAHYHVNATVVYVWDEQRRSVKCTFPLQRTRDFVSFAILCLQLSFLRFILARKQDPTPAMFYSLGFPTLVLQNTQFQNNTQITHRT